ncbi:MAG: tRNA pseudouridine(13) synthase TruD [Thermoplasmatales archaeon]|nr:MAG: tRNA pseudouridine(13) synthase TruD [Thermoplasmatales archaeon]
MSDFEKNIGIETYFTPQPGISGKLRSIPEDFIVEEIFLYPTRKKDGSYTIAEVSRKNWETHTLVKELSKKLHISRKRIGFAGTKDKRSCSTQLMSFHNVSKDELSHIKVKDVTIENICSSDKSVKIGDLHGNRFEITIRNIDNDVTSEKIQDTVLYLENQVGFPNFYGVQRFGIVRPITHIIGKHIIEGDFKKAVMSYVANPMKGESEDTYKVREELEKSHNFSQALQSYPDVLNFEKAILNNLVTDPDDFIGALKELPRNLLTMFIHAYQSYLFNKILSERIRKKIPINKAIVGDIVLPIRKNRRDDNGIIVKESNIEKVNNQISKGKAAVSGLLVGSDSIFSNGEMGEIERKKIEKERIDYRDFIIPEIPFISSSGSRRALLATINNMNWKLYDDRVNEGKQALYLKFELQKGCYATSLLREFMKSRDAKNY